MSINTVPKCFIFELCSSDVENEKMKKIKGYWLLVSLIYLGEILLARSSSIAGMPFTHIMTSFCNLTAALYTAQMLLNLTLSHRAVSTCKGMTQDLIFVFHSFSKKNVNKQTRINYILSAQ